MVLFDFLLAAYYSKEITAKKIAEKIVIFLPNFDPYFSDTWRA